MGISWHAQILGRRKSVAISNLVNDTHTVNFKRSKVFVLCIMWAAVGTNRCNFDGCIFNLLV